MRRILYSYFRSSASYRVRIALHYKNLDFEYAPIHLLNNGGEQNSDQFKKLNPMGQVPCLIEDDVVIGQSLAIFQYLDAKYPNLPLIPKDPLQAARTWEICEIINSGVQPLINLSVLGHLKSEFGASDENKISWSKHFIEKGFKSLEAMLSKSSDTYCVGNSVTAADMCLVPQVFSGARNNVDINDYPKLNSIWKACEKVEAFQKAHPKNQPDFVG